MVARATHLWHPFADMSRVAGSELVIERGEGCWVWDRDGRRYLDATASLWYCNVGHGRSELVEAAREQMTQLAAFHLFGSLANQPAIDLAERLCELSPIEGEGAAFLTSGGGSDAIDTAAKIARRYWELLGRPERRAIVARGGAYHGMNAFGTSLAGIEANASGWGPLVREVFHVAPHDPAALSDLLDRHGSEVAAFVGEPVIGAGGVHPPVDGYWADVRDLCREHDILLVADEVVTGFGRLGTWFASERFDIQPDMIVGAKGLTSGYVPAGVVLAGGRVREVLWDPGAGTFRHGYTYSGHPTACAVALANLDLIERDDLLGRVARLEPVLADVLGRLAEHPLVSEVRSIGLLAGVQLSPEAQQAAGRALLDDVVAAARDEGVLLRSLAGGALQISPPFVIGEDELRMLAQKLERALDAVTARGRTHAA